MTKNKFFKISVTACVLAIVLSNSIIASACTIFTKRDDSLVLVGNNEDWLYSNDSLYWIVKGNAGEYSRVCFGNSTYVQGGMNEKGLFYDGAACPQTQVPYDPNKKSLGMDAGEVVLSHCATVQEAIKFLGNYNISSSFGDHLLFADSSGDAAVIEWVNGKMKVVPEENNQLVATNFFLTAPDLGGYPSDRYNMAESVLSGSESLNLLEFSSICRSTTQDWGDGGTKYSNVYDLKALNVYIYQKADFSKVAVINLSDELNNLSSGDKEIANINTLSYTETSALLGGKVVDYRQIATISSSNSGSAAMSDTQTSNAGTVASAGGRATSPQNSDISYLTVVIAVVIAIVVALAMAFTIVILYFKARKHREK